MAEREWLTDKFLANRTHLRAVAYRMLGSATEADDAVQEAWLRLSRTDTSAVENLSAWLTTVIAHVCLDMLRSRKLRREESIDEHLPEPSADLPDKDGIDPEREAVLADSVGAALVIVLESLAPAERVAFVLHDMFDLSFDEIAPIVNRTPTAARQLASRARRRVQGAATASDANRTRHREVVSAFLAASRDGDFDALLAVLDPDVVLHADSVAIRAGVFPEARGAHAVAENFKGRARAAQLALLNQAVGAVWAPEGQPRAAFHFTIQDDKIVEINLVADPDELRQMEVVILGRAE